MPSLTGSCLCGAVALTIKDTTPVFAQGLELCHCHDCRRFTGALAGPLLMVGTDNVSISGQDSIHSFAVKSEAGNMLTRFWCTGCGCSLYDTNSIREGKRISIFAGHFPPGSLPKPTEEIWMRSAEKWEKPVDIEGVKVLETQ